MGRTLSIVPFFIWQEKSIEIGVCGELFVPVNGGYSSDKWLPRNEPVTVNNVNMTRYRLGLLMHNTQHWSCYRIH